MAEIDRRSLLAMTAGLAATPAIARAAAIDAHVKTGTLKDVEHVVILMQENRGFDHYFGTMNGVRGFADRFPIPVAGDGARTVWRQAGRKGDISPFPLDTMADFNLMRVEGTPHFWPDTQAAWDQGRMNAWPKAKGEHSMAYYRRADVPFHFALADAFTLCDAYHCSAQTGTNTNRLFLWSGTNDPSGEHGGPAIGNSHDSFPDHGGDPAPYTWTTYVERLQTAGIDWRTYLDIADYFDDNPIVGFKVFRDAHLNLPGSDQALLERARSDRGLGVLKADVLAGKLPQVSYIIAPAADSEHPVPSSPAQGADYIARVLDALTADPKVWAKTALFVMYDENDGFFDHVPPPAPPSRDEAGALLGGSTVDTTGEYHLVPSPGDKAFDPPALRGRPYGLGPRVPMLVISPWSRGGWVNSEVFDHTSVIRFLEARFGVAEPNITPWRRAVCGDLTSCFDFKTPNAKPFMGHLPGTAAVAAKAKATVKRTTPKTPEVSAPVQEKGPRLSRALPYDLEVELTVAADGVTLNFINRGKAGAVFHVYDRNRLADLPRRYTVEAGKTLGGRWASSEGDAYDLSVLGPNGFHRRFAGLAVKDSPRVDLRTDPRRGEILITMTTTLAGGRSISVTPATGRFSSPRKGAEGDIWLHILKAGTSSAATVSTKQSGGWYDVEITSSHAEAIDYRWRLAGRLEAGKPTFTDPAMHGPALMTLADWSPT
jgi:phospholipase C